MNTKEEYVDLYNKIKLKNSFLYKSINLTNIGEGKKNPILVKEIIDFLKNQSLDINIIEVEYPTIKYQYKIDVYCPDRKMKYTDNFYDIAMLRID